MTRTAAQKNNGNYGLIDWFNSLEWDCKMKNVTEKNQRKLCKWFKHNGSYVHTESISKQASFWDWKSPAFTVSGCHWLRLGNTQLSSWKILYSIPPTHRLYAVTNADWMQDIDNRHEEKNEFRKGRGPLQCQVNCCEIVRGTFLMSASYITNHQSRTSMSCNHDLP